MKEKNNWEQHNILWLDSKIKAFIWWALKHLTNTNDEYLMVYALVLSLSTHIKSWFSTFLLSSFKYWRSTLVSKSATKTLLNMTTMWIFNKYWSKEFESYIKTSWFFLNNVKSVKSLNLLLEAENLWGNNCLICFHTDNYFRKWEKEDELGITKSFLALRGRQNICLKTSLLLSIT